MKKINVITLSRFPFSAALIKTLRNIYIFIQLRQCWWEEREEGGASREGREGPAGREGRAKREGEGGQKGGEGGASKRGGSIQQTTSLPLHPFPSPSSLPLFSKCSLFASISVISFIFYHY